MELPVDDRAREPSNGHTYLSNQPKAYLTAFSDGFGAPILHLSGLLHFALSAPQLSATTKLTKRCDASPSGDLPSLPRPGWSLYKVTKISRQEQGGAGGAT